ncbi:superoxide dismutase family protein [Amphibacillus sp. MSJ-3]|nr:superoxide dismutase family protein [Amphibacillus sp. MSJ-3]
MNSEGMQVATATLTEKDTDGVHIVLEGENLPPGEHGFHIHEVGECIPPDFESAGGHYNPTNSKHGFEHPEGPHAGDLENIVVNEDGTVYAELDAPMVSLKRDHENTLFTKAGTSLVIHANPDDYISQPSGNSGKRIACGVIGE